LAPRALFGFQHCNLAHSSIVSYRHSIRLEVSSVSVWKRRHGQKRLCCSIFQFFSAYCAPPCCSIFQ
jgi:hypothetical protein